MKECSHFLSHLLCTSFFKLRNDELAFQVRVVPQIKHSVTSFISLLKHLVFFSTRKERGRKHIKAFIALSPVFLSWPLYYETCCLQERNEANFITDRFAKTHFHVRGHENSVWAAFPNSNLGLLP